MVGFSFFVTMMFWEGSKENVRLFSNRTFLISLEKDGQSKSRLILSRLKKV